MGGGIGGEAVSRGPRAVLGGGGTTVIFKYFNILPVRLKHVCK